MIITQLSNLFNYIVQQDPEAQFYHFGWPNDVNVNIPNNYDPSAATGRLFPYVLLTPPKMLLRAQANGTQSNYERFDMQLILIDTYSHTSPDLSQKIDTGIEVMAGLQALLRRILRALNDYVNLQALIPFAIADMNVDFDAYRFTDSSRSLSVTFSMTFPTGCEDYVFDPTLIPANFNDINKEDEENIYN